MSSDKRPDRAHKIIDKTAQYGRYLFISILAISIINPLLRGNYEQGGKQLAFGVCMILMVTVPYHLVKFIRAGFERFAKIIVDIGFVREMVVERWGLSTERVAYLVGGVMENLMLVGIIVAVVLYSGLLLESKT